MAFLRLHKYMADHGVASRRKCEEYIRQGLVKVNGKMVTDMGVKIDPEKDEVLLDPSLRPKNFMDRAKKQKFIYIALNKPVGYVSTVTGEEKPSVMELLRGVKERVFPVGRLDKETEGLLLFTNDGRFAYEMTHPKFEKEKEYEVEVSRPIPEGALEKLRAGMKLWGEKTKPTKIRRLTAVRFRIILEEGKNRQIRRICQKVGYPVSHLRRVRVAGLWLGDLALGKWRFLREEEIKKITTF